MSYELPGLDALPNRARRQILAALRAVPARGVSEEELERREEHRAYEQMMLDRFRAETPTPRAYRAAVKAWRQNHRNLRFIQKLAELLEEQRREDALGRFFERAILMDTPPRKITDELGMRLSDVTWRLKCARADIARKRQGLMTRRELAATLRKKYWIEARAAIEQSRDPATGQQRRAGRPRKATP